MPSSLERTIVVIAHNLRSCHNVGSLLRTADGLGISEVYLTGYTPYPLSTDDTRLPHISTKIDKLIHKTALGAEHSVTWQHKSDIYDILDELREQGYVIAALEQTADSTALQTYRPPSKIALILGREVEGIEQDILDKSDIRIEIPMTGQKESYNVVIAAAMAMYHIRYAFLQA